MKKIKILLYVLLCAFSVPLIAISDSNSCNKKGKVIFLNGTSSSGKSTLAVKLQEIFKEPFFYYGFDSFFRMFSEKFYPWGALGKTEGMYYVYRNDDNGFQLTELHLNPDFYNLYHEISPAIVKAIISKGGSVIVDEMMIYDATFSHWQKVLDGECVVYVSVKAPINVIEMREKQRGDRPVGLSKYYLDRTHKHIPYDLVVDTENESPNEIAIKISEVFKNKNNFK